MPFLGRIRSVAPSAWCTVVRLIIAFACVFALGACAACSTATTSGTGRAPAEGPAATSVSRLPAMSSGATIMRPVDIQPTTVPLRRVSGADFALSGRTGAMNWFIVHEPASGRFARYSLPSVSGDPIEFLSLSKSGRQALFAAMDAGPQRRLVLLNLDSGVYRWFDTDPDTYGAGALGTLSPDGRAIGTVTVVTDPAHSSDEDSSLVAVGVIDVATGTYRRLWVTNATAGWGDGSGVAWSPDGQEIAATYLSADPSLPDSDFATVIVSTDGHQLASPRIGTFIVPTSNAAWLSPTQLVLGSTASDEGTIVDLATGGHRDVATSQVLARDGRLLIQLEPTTPNTPVTLAVRDIEATTAKTWLRLPAGTSVTKIDVL